MTRLRRHHSVELAWVIAGVLKIGLIGRPAWWPIQPRNESPCNSQRVAIIESKVVRDTGEPGVDICSAEILCTDFFAGGGLHQRRPTQENRALLFDDNRLIAHGGHIRASRRARAHHDSNLRDAFCRHLGLIKENPAEMLTIWKDVVLIWQIRAARIHEINARQIVLLSNFLGPKMLFHR